MRRYISGYVVIMALLLISLTACKKHAEVPDKKKEVLIYCGITMIRPMQEIARIIEEEQDCIIKFTKGGSGNLLKSLQTNQLGDLYLPGSDSYIQTCLQEELVSDTVFVGYNRTALLVQKGNPKQISADLINLTDKELAVVLGNPESGSIGKATKTLLEQRGIFQESLDNALYLTTDSKDLTKAIQEKTADVVINWHATSVWPENIEFMDSIRIDEQYAPRKKLVLGLLTFAKQPDIARRFQEYAASPEGQAIFMKYGFLEPDDLDK